MLKYLPFLLSLSFNAQSQTELNKYYNEEFGWTITIPENFIRVSSEEWSKMQNRGAEAIEETYSAEVVNQATILFVFKSGEYNYLESNYQPYDVKVDGSYLESVKDVNEILYGTFTAQMPNARIDSTSSVATISGLEFQTFKIKVDFLNGMVMNMLMYTRLFGEKEFSMNIIYLDEKQGKKMVDAWLNSKFE